MCAAAMTPPTLSIVMPAYDEATGIADAVSACVGCAAELVRTGRVAAVQTVVVDDGSGDGTAELLDRLAERHPELAVVHHDTNRGLGAALRSGFARADGDLIFYTDADLPVDLAVIATALDLLTDDVDAVSAYRSRRRGEGPRRFVYSLAYNSLCRVTLGLRVRDVNFAAKLLRTEQVHALDLRSEGSFIDAELMARLHHSGATIRQFPALYRPRSRGVSTLSSGRVVLTILQEMQRLGPSVRRGGQLRTTGV